MEELKAEKAFLEDQLQRALKELKAYQIKVGRQAGTSRGAALARALAPWGPLVWLAGC